MVEIINEQQEVHETIHLPRDSFVLGCKFTAALSLVGPIMSIEKPMDCRLINNTFHDNRKGGSIAILNTEDKILFCAPNLTSKEPDNV